MRRERLKEEQHQGDFDEDSIDLCRQMRYKGACDVLRQLFGLKGCCTGFGCFRQSIWMYSGQREMRWGTLMFFCEVGSGRRDKVRRLRHGVVPLV